MRIVPLVLLILCGAANAEEITFRTDDGVTLYADWHTGASEQAGTIILFHQARGSARGEYPYITERLNNMGFNVLAVDQRSGGTLFGPRNRTVDALERKDFSYCEAWPDLLASINAARARSNGALLAWGSSYSAGLVLRLGALHGDKVDAVLAFSPAAGGPMVDCSPNGMADRIKVPAAAFRPSREMDSPNAKAQALELRAAGVVFNVIEDGVHGSSMLVPGRSAADIEAAWDKVEDFIDPFLNR